MYRSISRYALLSLVAVMSLSSCLNKETALTLPPAPPPVPGDVLVSSVAMGSDYKLQVFYNLEHNTVVGSNDFTAWDLGFETGASGWHVVMNTARFMKVYKTKKDFTTVKIADTAGLGVIPVDRPSGSLDSTAFGDWRDGSVYVIARGYNELGQDQGMMKVKVLSVDDKAYQVRFAKMDGSGDNTVEVKKDDAYNLSFLSFEGGGKTLLVEPPKANWDVVFTKYTHLYYDLNNMPYSVVGCVLNRYKTTGAQYLNSKFADIKLQDAMDVKLSEHIDAIGFEWKTYTGTTYKVDTTRNYVVRNSGGLYFKLRFIGFLDKTGVKGSPAWEYQRL